jgi:hypothetical protein
MMFAAVVGHRSGRATPSLRGAPQRQSMEIVRRETIYRNRNAVQTNPATSEFYRQSDTLASRPSRPHSAATRDQCSRSIFAPAIGALPPWMFASFLAYVVPLAAIEQAVRGATRRLQPNHCMPMR